MYVHNGQLPSPKTVFSSYRVYIYTIQYCEILNKQLYSENLSKQLYSEKRTSIQVHLFI